MADCRAADVARALARGRVAGRCVRRRAPGRPSRARACACAFITAALCGPAAGQDLVTAWCDAQGGEREVALQELDADGVPRYAGRVDCLTATHAVEVEDAGRWYTAIGQALWYGLLADRRAGVALIVEEPRDLRYLRRLRAVVDGQGLAVEVWGVGP
jgi:hypothetical protein